MGAGPSPFQADVRLDARESWPGTGSYTDKERPDATTCPSQPGRARYNGLAKPGGGTYGTGGSATVHVCANDFTAERLTFRNLFGRLANPSVTGTRAVAPAVEGDRQTYLDCVFYGHQDSRNFTALAKKPRSG